VSRSPARCGSSGCPPDRDLPGAQSASRAPPPKGGPGRAPGRTHPRVRRCPRTKRRRSNNGRHRCSGCHPPRSSAHPRRVPVHHDAEERVVRVGDVDSLESRMGAIRADAHVERYHRQRDIESEQSRRRGVRCTTVRREHGRHRRHRKGLRGARKPVDPGRDGDHCAGMDRVVDLVAMEPTTPTLPARGYTVLPLTERAQDVEGTRHAGLPLHWLRQPGEAAPTTYGRGETIRPMRAVASIVR